jgi:hypothetical protein
MPEIPSRDNRTSHRSRHDEHIISLRKRWPMKTLGSKYKNDPFKGQFGQGKHPNWRKTIMHGTNSGRLRALFCVPGGIFRPEFLKLNLTPDCQALSRTMTGVWESLFLLIGYAKAILVGGHWQRSPSISCPAIATPPKSHIL